MELMYTNSISTEVAEMYIYSEIGYGVDAQSFVNELNYITKFLKIPNVNVRINSPGGGVVDGMGIFAAIQNSEAQINTYIDGIAASAAGFIAMAGKKRYMAAHGQLMMHNVSGGYADSPEEQAKIDNAKASLEDSIATILSNNSGSKEDVKVKMNQETWIGANEALELKFIDSIYDNTPKKRMAKNELMQFVNSIVKPNIKTMNKVLNYFNLNEDATEEVVIEKIEEVKAEADKVEALEAEIADLKEKLNAFEVEKTEKEEAEKEAIALAEVENAINAGKFDASKKEDLVKSAKNDIEGFKNLVSSIVVAKAPKLTDLLNQGKTKPEGREDWTIRDWEKNDPAGLKNIIDNEPDTYKEMYDAYYRPDKNNN
jgi:ATP-dependent protease ClpP protease subunit